MQLNNNKSKAQLELEKRTLFIYIRKNILEAKRINLARALSVSDVTICSIENGRLPVSRNIFLALYVLLLQYKTDFYLYNGDKKKLIDDVIDTIEKKYLDINYIELFD